MFFKLSAVDIAEFVESVGLTPRWVAAVGSLSRLFIWNGAVPPPCDIRSETVQGFFRNGGAPERFGGEWLTSS